MRFTVMLLVVFFGVASHCSNSNAAVRTTPSTSYALRPCSTCKEIVYPTEAQCRQAAFDKATEVGATRSSGSAVYTCITRFNVIATFYEAPPINQAVLKWTYTHTDGYPDAEGFYIVYGKNPAELVNTIRVANPATTTYTIKDLAPGTYYFALKSYASGTESVLSPIVSKVIL